MVVTSVLLGTFQLLCDFVHLPNILIISLMSLVSIYLIAIDFHNVSINLILFDSSVIGFEEIEIGLCITGFSFI